MRLKEEERQIIIQAVKSIDPKANLYLFGSRVDDSSKGGDIDLLILSDKIDYGDKLNIKKVFLPAFLSKKLTLL